MAQLNQRGSSHLIALVGVLVIAVVGFAAYRVMNTGTIASTASSPVVATVDSNRAPAKIQNSTDLKKASNALDSTPIDGSVNPNDLNSDLSAIQ